MAPVCNSRLEAFGIEELDCCKEIKGLGRDEGFEMDEEEEEEEEEEEDKDAIGRREEDEDKRC